MTKALALISNVHGSFGSMSCLNARDINHSSKNLATCSTTLVLTEFPNCLYALA